MAVFVALYGVIWSITLFNMKRAEQFDGMIIETTGLVTVHIADSNFLVDEDNERKIFNNYGYNSW